MTQSVSSEPQPFKAYFGPPLVEDLAQRLLAVQPVFPVVDFIAEVAPQLEPLELKGRVAAIAAGLRRHLPPDYSAAVDLLLAILGPPTARPRACSPTAGI